jgi:hypothetical protein
VAAVPFVYHVSETRGIEEFVPRKFWHINYTHSGPVTAESDLPADAEIISCFYASSEEYAPFYYPPKRCQRLFVWRRKNPESFDRVAELFGRIKSDKVLVFDQRDRPSLESHEFSVYSFDAREFHRLPNGEYLSHQIVVPVAKVCHRNSLKHLLQAGYQVEFVADLWQTRQQMLDLELRVDSEGIGGPVEAEA